MTEKAENKPETEKKEPPAEKLSVTQHAVTVGGREMRYTVTTGTIVLKEESEKKGEAAGESEGEKPKAAMFFIAYTLDDVADRGRRPLTFSFNGGPGSSSVWLHLGVLGPRRVWMDETGNLPQPPFRLVDNEHTLLDETDLVFIDPVGTGYSRPVPGEKARDYYGFKKDLESVGEFIRLYATRYQRWLSPKFLIGESYGTTRAAGLSGYLQDRLGMYLNGIMLVSAVLDFGTVSFDPGNDLPYILYLPTYAATAWYHQRLPADLQADLPGAVAAARAFAGGEYAAALMQGAALPARERARIVRQLARFTGLAPEFIERANLRIEIMRFTKELLRSERRTVGRLDSRFKGIDRDAAGEQFEYDPSMATIMGPYTAAFNDYVRGELQYETDTLYEILHPLLWQHWSYAQHENQYVNVADTLRQAMTVNPHLKVLVANGYFDLATPFFATEYIVQRLGLDPSLQGNLSLTYYPAGHMMYIHQSSLAQLKQDLAAFVRGAVPPAE